jgi:FAD binding domain
VEYGRLYSWGNDPAQRGGYINGSPTIHVDLPQDRLEPILVTEAAGAGAHVRFSTEMTDLGQSDDGVTTSVCDRLTDEKFEIRSAYVIGADGANSRVAEILGLPMIGTTNLGVLSAPFSRLTFHDFTSVGPGFCIGSSSRAVRAGRAAQLSVLSGLGANGSCTLASILITARRISHPRA